MKNLTLLNKKCAGWKPSDVANYVKKCDHTSHLEKEFSDILNQSLKEITQTAAPERKVFLYNEPKNTWPQEKAAAYAQAKQLHFGEFGADVSVSLKMFKPEDNYVYYLIEAKQGGEEVELLFLEEMR